jgi:hypothetical protein
MRDNQDLQPDMTSDPSAASIPATDTNGEHVNNVSYAGRSHDAQSVTTGEDVIDNTEESVTRGTDVIDSHAGSITQGTDVIDRSRDSETHGVSVIDQGEHLG